MPAPNEDVAVMPQQVVEPEEPSNLPLHSLPYPWFLPQAGSPETAQKIFGRIRFGQPVARSIYEEAFPNLSTAVPFHHVPVEERGKQLGAAESAGLSAATWLLPGPKGAGKEVAGGTIEAMKRIAAETGLGRTGEEDLFFGQIYPKLAELTGMTFEPHEYEKASQVALNDLEGFVRKNPHFTDYYQEDLRKAADHIGEHTGKPLNDEEYNLFRFLNGMFSTSTPLEQNSKESYRGVLSYRMHGNLRGFGTYLKPQIARDKAGKPLPTQAVFRMTGNEGSWVHPEDWVEQRGDRKIQHKEGDPWQLVKASAGLPMPVTLGGGAPAIKAESMRVFSDLVDKLGGVNKAIDYLKEPVSLKELKAFNKEVGYAGDPSNLGQVKAVVKFATGQDEQIPRIFIFGKKVGAYTLNNIGDHRYNTSDVWDSRFTKTYFKGLLEDRTGIHSTVDEQKLSDNFVTSFIRKYRERIDPNAEVDAIQAARWFYILDASGEMGYTRALTRKKISDYVLQGIEEDKARARGVEAASINPPDWRGGTPRGPEGSRVLSPEEYQIRGYQQGGEVAGGSPAGGVTSLSDFLDSPSSFTARATGYHPVDPGDRDYSMEGGHYGAEAWHGQQLPNQEPLFTLDQYRRGQAPYVSVAMDNTLENPHPYGTFLASPQMPGVKFRVMDTGRAFRGRGTSRIDIARDSAAGADSPENNRDLDFTAVPEDHDFGEQVRAEIGRTPQRKLLAGNVTQASLSDFLDAPSRSEIDQYLDEHSTSTAIAHGLIHGGFSVAAGWGAAAAGDASGFNEVVAAATGPAAPITFGGLNMLEFLGGSLLGAKGIDTAEKALERYVPVIQEMNQAAKQHPVANEIAQQIPMLPFAWKSAKGYYNLAKAAEGVGDAAKVIAMRAGGGAAAGAGVEAIRPHVENAFNAIGLKLGFTPGEVKDPTIRSFMENAAIGAALNGAFGARAIKDTTVDPVEGGEAHAQKPDEKTSSLPAFQGVPPVGEAEGEVQAGDPRYETAPQQETVTGGLRREVGNLIKTTTVPAPTAPTQAPQIGRFGAGKRLVLDTFGRWLGVWSRARQNANFWSGNIGRRLTKAIPDPARRIAMYNWAAAGGDQTVLADWVTKAPQDVAQGYKDAMNLTQEEQQMAMAVRDSFDHFLERGRQTGMLEKGTDDYLKRIVTKRPEIADEELRGAFTSSSKLNTTFVEARRRFWENMVDAERQGVRYDKDIARSLYEYSKSFAQASIDRAAKRHLFDLETPNGRPLFITSGRGEVIGEDQANKSLLVTPYGVRRVRGQADEAAKLKQAHPSWSDEKAGAIAKQRILSEYQPVDAPSLRNWQWVNTLDDGTNVLVQGDVLVHKSIAEIVKNKFGRQPTDTWWDTFAKVQGFIKGSKLSLSIFHDVHERVNAAGHLVNSFNIRPMEDLNVLPEIQNGLKNGLALHGFDQDSALFAEGMAAHGWPEMVPGLGKYVRAYKDAMFEDWIPRYKAEMYLKALERNRARYGKLNEEQLATLTSKQSAATFGQQNYMMMMGKMTSNPRFWKQMQVFFLAPDFGLAKLQHIGQAFTPYGGEQRMAIGLVAAGLYTGARFLNSVLNEDGNAHWEPEHAFSVIVGDRQYSLRSLPGDMQHLFSNPRSYVYHRLSPGVNSAIEHLTTKDSLGRTVGWKQEVVDLLMQPVPIPAQRAAEEISHQVLGTKAVRYDMRDLVGSTLGLSTAFYKDETELRKWITSWKNDSGNPKLIAEVERNQASTFPPSQYNDMRDALSNDDFDVAKNAYDKLVQDQGGDTKAIVNIRTQMKKWAEAPFTGSRKNEAAFKRSLDPDQLKTYEKSRAARKHVYQNFLQLKRGLVPLLSPESSGDASSFLDQ